MAQVAKDLQKEITSVMNILKLKIDNEGRTEKSRLLAIAVTHLETAKLFIKETV